MKKLFIISNESIYENNNKYFCDNIDLKSTPEGLGKNFEIALIARKSNVDRSFEINLPNIRIFNSIFPFLCAIKKSTESTGAKYLLISISPYTFLAGMFLKLLGKTPIVYLRSNGHEEYRTILGFFGPAIYHFMFSIISSFSNLISCRDYILKGKPGSIVLPSQIDKDWLSNIKNIEIKNFKLLYVGRLRKEKGIFSFLKMIRGKNDFFLTIVGSEKNDKNKLNQSNVITLGNESNKNNLIKLYDDHNILVLPSFTEGHPMVLLEALARTRPVVIFKEINHVIGNKKGIFVSDRNYESFLNTINHIKNNYQRIQEEMKQNKLPTHEEFVKKLGNLILNPN